jgi:hypothetical protein
MGENRSWFPFNCCAFFLSLPVLAQQAKACHGVIQALAVVRFIYSSQVLERAAVYDARVKIWT